MVSLTSAGRRALGPLDVAHKRLADATAGSLSADERRVFTALAEKIRSSLSALVEDGVPLAKGTHGQR